MPHIVILSGPSGAGKSGVARSLCERYDRTVHIETDIFFDMIQMGRVDRMRPESERQNSMVSRAVARAATAYAQDLYAVFIDGVIGPHLLPVYLDELRPAGLPVHFVLLRPTLEETLRRVVPRDPARRMTDDQHRELHAQFVRYGDFAGITLNNTSLTADQAADRVMDACGGGDCLVLPPAR
jgi:chloramphenicol 3-O-phosphotransferase